MDENNNQSHNPPSQKDKEARRRSRTGARIAAGVMAPGAFGVYRLGKAVVNKLNPPESPPPRSQNDASRAVDEVGPQPTPKVPLPHSRTKNIGEKVLMYSSPGAFLIGKFGPRLRERFFAKKKIEELEKEARRTSAAGLSKAPSKPTRFQEFKKTKLWKIGTSPIKYGTVAGLLYTSFRKLRGNKKETKPTPSAQIENNEEQPTEQTVPVRETVKTPSVPTPLKKTWKYYQKAWNNSRIRQAIARGFNRNATFQKIKSSPLWKPKAFKYALGVVPAAIYDLRKHNENKPAEAMGQSEQQSSQPTGRTKPLPSLPTKLWRGYSNATPYGIGKNAWNRFAAPRLFGRGRRQRIPGQGRVTGTTRETAQNAAQSPAKNLAQNAGKRLLAAVSNIPQVRIAIIAGAIILFLIICMVAIIVIAVSGGGNDSSGATPGGEQNGIIPGANANPIPGFAPPVKTVDKTQSTYPEPITYTITFSPSTNPAIKTSDITISDQLSAQVVYQNASGNPTFNLSTNTIFWDLSDPTNISPLTVTVIPTQDNVEIKNTASAFTTASSSGGTPNSNTCGGFYSLNNPVGNFGDPECYFANSASQAKSDLYNQLRTLDPTNADFWYLKVVPCESGYNPNAYLAASQSGQGAYGLFQMNPTGHGNGQYDAGDVRWNQQVENAINYSKLISSIGAYWACAR